MDARRRGQHLLPTSLQMTKLVFHLFNIYGGEVLRSTNPAFASPAGVTLLHTWSGACCVGCIAAQHENVTVVLKSTE